MRRASTIVIILVVSALSLAGCAGGAAETAFKGTPSHPASGEEVGVIHKVGETVECGNHTITVNSFERNGLLVVNVTLANISTRDFELQPSQLFDAIDSEGNRLQFHPKDEPDALAGTLVGGGTLTGDIYFDISPDQTGIMVHYHAVYLAFRIADVLFALD